MSDKSKALSRIESEEGLDEGENMSVGIGDLEGPQAVIPLSYPRGRPLPPPNAGYPRRAGGRDGR